MCDAAHLPCYVQNGMHQLPLFQGVPSIDILKAMELKTFASVVTDEEMKKKLENHLDKKTIEDVDYLSPEKLKYYRKKTLDVGNEAIRDFERSVDAESCRRTFV